MEDMWRHDSWLPTTTARIGIAYWGIHFLVDMLLFFFWFRLLNDVQSQVFVLVSVSIQFVPWTMGTCTCLCGGSLFVVRATPDGAGGHEAYSPWN